MSVMNNVLGSLLEEAETNETLRKMYAKHNCKKCYGRGVITLSVSMDQQFVCNNLLCDCVVRTIKRELKNG